MYKNVENPRIRKKKNSTAKGFRKFFLRLSSGEVKFLVNISNKNQSEDYDLSSHV